MLCWLTLVFFLNLVHQNYQLETKSGYQRGFSKPILESHMEATVQYSFQTAK